MYLKKIEIIGFKSFADKTVLEFSPGITAIVGPNGCGKSNILDAIRWSLGEQSVKTLRANRMEDIIFNGTDRHAPLGMAEVSLTLSNEDRLLNLDTDEVVITRRLFRSGESEYLINRQTCRLKDITELLMGTGMGAAAYSIIEQGKIGLILSAKPEERRYVFDEAAGITKYKSKKKEAMRKLADTEQNLLRITDIISEVKRQVNYLERQAQKAKKYRELYEGLKEKEIVLALKRSADIDSELNETKNNINAIEKEISIMESQVKERQALSSQIKERAIAIEEELNALQEQLSVLDAERERCITQDTINKERIAELEKDLNFFSKEREEILSKIDSHKMQIQALEKEKAVLSEGIKNIELEAGKIKQKINSILESGKGLEAEKEKLSSSALEKERLVSQLRNELHKLELQINNKLNHIERITKEISAIDYHIESLNQKKYAIHSEIEALQKKIQGQILPQIQEKQISINQTTEKIGKVEQEIDKISSQILEIETQKEFIMHLDTKYVNLPETQGLDIWIKDTEFNPGNIVANIKDLMESRNGWSHYKIEAKILPRDLNQIDSTLQSLYGQMQEQRQQLEELNAARQDSLAQMQELITDKMDTENKIKHISSGLSEIDSDIKSYQEEKDITQKEKDSIKSELASMEGKKKQTENSLEQTIERAAEIERTMNLLDLKIKQSAEQKINLQQELAKLDARKQVINANIKNIEERIDSLHKAIEYEQGSAQKREEIQKNARLKIEFLKSQLIELEVRKNEIEKEVTILRAKRDNVRKDYQEIRSSVESYELAISEWNKKISAKKEEIYRGELKQQELEFKKKAIETHILENYSIALPEARASVIMPPDINEDMLLQEIEQMRNRIKRLGQVNTVAIEEYEELKERYEFLTKQHDDLVKAKDNLKNTIKQINIKSVEVFKETFAKIREEFKHIFRMLFGGGSADISIINEDDVLESGIEITAKPSGKQPKSIMLLSGGEKSLTAIALIFAIFKVNPSPFCVLDEVEAALDESNVDRFVRMLKDFATRSQFLVITHNKKSIAASDAIYGVTMPTVGVSKIISVKLLEDNKTRENTQTTIRHHTASIKTKTA